MIPMRPLLLATRNAGKVAELLPLVAAHGWGVETLVAAGIPEVPAEAGLEEADTFAANALAKARYFARLTGRVVLADDSGLEVAALGGAPGVHSKRWAGAHLMADGAEVDAANNRHLLQALTAAGAATPAARRARYVCAAAAAWPDGAFVAEGTTGGHILLEPAGTGGFGYDPLFWSEELQASFGQLSREAKGEVSHRGRAFTALLTRLRTAFPDRPSDGHAVVSPGARAEARGPR